MKTEQANLLWKTFLSDLKEDERWTKLEKTKENNGFVELVNGRTAAVDFLNELKIDEVETCISIEDGRWVVKITGNYKGREFISDQDVLDGFVEVYCQNSKKFTLNFFINEEEEKIVQNIMFDFLEEVGIKDIYRGVNF